MSALVREFSTQRGIVLAAALASLLVAAFAAASVPDKAPTEALDRSGEARVGAPAPWLAGWTLDDKVWNLRKAFADTSTDRVALVFFATWCAPCREGIRQLTARAADLRAAGVSVVLVNYQEDAARVRGFLDGTPAFPVVVDRFGACEAAYLRTGDDQVRLPRTVIVGRDMAVRAIYGAEGPDYVDRIIGGH